MDIRTFMNQIFGTLHIMIDSQRGLCFFAAEVLSYLGYSNPADILAKKVDAEDKWLLSYKECPPEFRSMIWTTTNLRSKVLINESGFYTLVLSSKLPEAQSFRRWVTHTVLPEIRKNGGYILGQEDLDPKELEELRDSVRALSDKVAYLTKRRRELRVEVSKLQQDKKDLKQKNKVCCSEAAEQMDYYIRLIQECADLEDEVQRMKNILHIRTVKKPGVDEDSEAERAKRKMYTVDREGFVVIKTDVDF